MSKEITKRIIEKIVADRNLISDRDWLKVAASLVPMSSDITTGASKKLVDACRKQGIEISETDGSDLIEQSEFGKMLINGINERDQSEALYRGVTSRRPFMEVEEDDDDEEESDDW